MDIVARILVIDDDPLISGWCRQALEMEGYEVAEASNGVEGLALFRERPAAVVLCDIFMPEKDGLETILALRQESAGPKIIAMSGGGLGGLVSFNVAARQLGAVRTLQKPFGIATLVGAVREALAGEP